MSTRRLVRTARARSRLEELKEIEDVACPGPGACGGQYTANTMAMFSEMIGICPMGMADIPAMDDDKDRVSVDAGELILKIIEQDIRPSKIITRTSLENAVAAIAASGGSTNGVLHTLAFAREAGIHFTIDDIEQISKIDAADLRPDADRQVQRGRYVSRGRRAPAGAAPDRRRLRRWLGLTCTGRRWPKKRRTARETPGQQVIRTWTTRSALTAGCTSSRATSRRTAASSSSKAPSRRSLAGRRASSTARKTPTMPCKNHEINAGDVVVIRYEGPVGDRYAGNASGDGGDCRAGTGRRRDVGHRRALLRRDARLDDRAYRAGSGVGGAIGLLKKATSSPSTSTPARSNVELSDDELTERRQAWHPAHAAITSGGVMAKYARLVRRPTTAR